MWIALVAFTDDISLTDEEWNEPLFAEYRDVVLDTIVYDHDLASFVKELKDQNHDINRQLNMMALTVKL